METQTARVIDLTDASHVLHTGTYYIAGNTGTEWWPASADQTEAITTVYTDKRYDYYFQDQNAHHPYKSFGAQQFVIKNRNGSKYKMVWEDSKLYIRTRDGVLRRVFVIPASDLRY